MRNANEGNMFYELNGEKIRLPILSSIPKIHNPILDIEKVVHEKEKEIRKEELKYCFKLWKKGIFYVIRVEDIQRIDEEHAEYNVTLCGLKSKEEIEAAKELGWKMLDFSKWTEEMFKKEGIEE